MAQLINDATLNAELDGTDIEAKSLVTVELEDVWFNKKADKTTWTDGYLTYTIEVKNNGEATTVPPGEPLTNVVFTDTIPPAIARVIESTIAVDPAAKEISHSYNSTSGLLTVSLTDMPVQDVVLITFQVERTL